jgi:large subunit ribosomal protein L23
MVQEPEVRDEKKAVILKADTGRAHHILQNYHLSEKSNLMSATGRYTFKVSKFANKLEVKKAVEKVYDVHVVSVNMVTGKGKVRRSGRVTGHTSDWKKAYVTLKEGERISGLSEGV